MPDDSRNQGRLRRWIGIAAAATALFGVLSILTWNFRVELAGSRGMVGLTLVVVPPVLFAGSVCFLAALLLAVIRRARR